MPPSRAGFYLTDYILYPAFFCPVYGVHFTAQYQMLIFLGRNLRRSLILLIWLIPYLRVCDRGIWALLMPHGQSLIMFSEI